MNDSPIKELQIKSKLKAYKCSYKLYDDRLVLSERKWWAEREYDIKLFWISKRHVGLRSIGYIWYCVSAFFMFFGVLCLINGISDPKQMQGFIAFLSMSLPSLLLAIMFSSRCIIYTNSTVNISFMRLDNENKIYDFMETLHEVKLRWLARRSGEIKTEPDRNEFISLIKVLYDENVVSENEYKLFREQVESKTILI